jgi:hypothetical protein
MSTFSLSQTGTEINSAISKVHNADTSPTQGSTNMVTSGGVHTAVNNIGTSALPITTEAQGIANYDNDDKVPTNAAVKDYFHTYLPAKFALFSISNNTSDNIDRYDQRLNVNGTVISESFASVSNGIVTLSSGTYEILLTGLWHDATSYNRYWTIELKNQSIDRVLDYFKVFQGDDVSSSRIVINQKQYQPRKATTIYSSASSFNLEVYANASSGINVLRYVDVRLLVRKLA